MVGIDLNTGAIVWSFRVTGGEARDLRREPFLVGGGLSSFGENAAGELFAISLDGTIYRLT